MRQSHTLLAIVAAVTMTLALGIPVAADLNLVPGDSAQVAYTNGEGVNVRDMPGYGGGILSTLGEGVAVTIVDGPVTADDGSSWYHVSADTWDGLIEGWVIADYVSGDGSYVASSSEDSSRSFASIATGSANVSGTDGYGLRLRDGASINAGILTVMPEGDAVNILASGIYDDAGTAWSQVDYYGTVGYAASAYLSGGGGGGDVVEEPAPAAPELVSTGGLSIGANAIVSGTGGGGLNLRAESWYGASVLTVIAEGGVVTIIDGPVTDDSGTGWYQVDHSSMVGWVHGGYLAWTDSAPTVNPDLGSVDTPPTQEPTPEPAPQPPAAEPTPEPVVEPEPEPEPEPQPVAPVSAIGDAVVAEALNWIGTPYAWGGTTPSGFDCSGFTYYVVNKVAGVGISRSLEVQAVSGSYVSPENLMPGDLVFQQNTYKWGLSHVGIYIGGGQMVNAQSERVGVVIADLWDSYWGPRYYTARRVV